MYITNNINIFFFFFKHQTIETHAPTFLTLNILAIGRMRRYGKSRKYSFKFPYLGIYFWRIKAQCALRCAHAAAAASMNVHKYCARVVSLKHSRPTSRLPRAASALGLNSKNPPKIKIREIDGSYSCLQRVDKCSACYDRKRKLL